MTKKPTIIAAKALAKAALGAGKTISGANADLPIGNCSVMAPTLVRA